jgi:hypothetical protein
MARSSDVIARVADATGEPHSGVLYVVRALRKDPGLFIKGRQGASRNAPHAQPHHLVNLLIGILAAKQAALRELPDLVGRYRGMTLFGLSPDNPMARAELEGLHNRAGLADRTATLQNFLTALGLPPGTLGQALDALVRGPDRYRPGSVNGGGILERRAEQNSLT